jgi:hypothetical protein
MSWGIFPEEMTGLYCNRSQSLSVLVISTLLCYNITSWYIIPVSILLLNP